MTIVTFPADGWIHLCAVKINVIMKTNMGSTDRIIRLLLAALFIGLYATGVVTGTFGIILLVLSVVFAITAYLRFCPLYLPFGINSCKR